MCPRRSERKLAAILFTDLVGSTERMARSEEAGLHVKRRHRELVRDQVARFHGNFVEAPGDESLSIFPNTLDAVNCGLALADCSEDEDFALHIAIHLGDVLVENGEVHGDGVNIAARLLPLSAGGGICISNEAYQAVRNQPGLEAEGLGEHELKNVGRAIEVLSLRRAAGAPRVSHGPPARGSRSSASPIRTPIAALLVVGVAIAGALAWWQLAGDDGARTTSKSGVRSIAVLPLENLSNDPDQEYFTVGMTQALASDLAKLAAFDVVSRTSVLQYRGAPKPMAQIARELDVDAVVEGSVLRAGESVRITVQLIDARSDRSLWSKSYERNLTDVIALQRQVAEAIAGQVQIELATDGRPPQRPARPVDPEAYKAYLKGLYFLEVSSRKAHARGVNYLEEAVGIDPEYAPAWAALSMGYT